MKAIKYFFYGILIGLLAGLVARAFLFVTNCEVFDLLSCVLSCGRSTPTYGKGINNLAIFGYPTVVCAGIGLLWGIAAAIKDASIKKKARLELEEKNRVVRYAGNKSAMESLIDTTLNEFNHSVAFVNNGVDVELYRNSSATSTEIRRLTESINKTESMLSRFDSEMKNAK